MQPAARRFAGPRPVHRERRPSLLGRLPRTRCLAPLTRRLLLRLGRRPPCTRRLQLRKRQLYVRGVQLHLGRGECCMRGARLRLRVGVSTSTSSSSDCSRAMSASVCCSSRRAVSASPCASSNAPRGWLRRGYCVSCAASPALPCRQPPPLSATIRASRSARPSSERAATSTCSAPSSVAASSRAAADDAALLPSASLTRRLGARCAPRARTAGVARPSPPLSAALPSRLPRPRSAAPPRLPQQPRVSVRWSSPKMLPAEAEGSSRMCSSRWLSGLVSLASAIMSCCCSSARRAREGDGEIDGRPPLAAIVLSLTALGPTAFGLTALSLAAAADDPLASI